MVTRPSASIRTVTFSDGQTVHLAPDDKILLVGPNNSGKSLTLREIGAIANSARADFDHTLVVKHLGIKKLGTSEQLRDFLDTYAALNGEFYVLNDWKIHRGHIREWDRELLPHMSQAFIKNIAAEERLQITKLQESVSPGKQKTLPQHVLYDDEALMTHISGLFKKSFGQELFFDFRGGSHLPIHVGKPPLPQHGEDRVSNSYVERVRKQPLLHEQGDGVKSYAGLLFEAVATERDITLIDEPEAFLHPPQMRRLGETLAQEVKGQLVVATHSSDVMRGFLTGRQGEIRIFRMQRNGSENEVTETSIDTIKMLWDRPDLRYSNALEGVFHEETIICEDDSDCRLINSIADFLELQDGGSWKDTAYVPAGGKHGVPRIAEVLLSIGVPVKAVFDMDFLAEKELVKRTVEAFGGSWEEIKLHWERVDSAVRQGQPAKTVSEVKSNMIACLTKSEKEKLPKKELEALMKQGKAWSDVKNYGRSGIPKGDAREYFRKLEESLRSLGIYLIPVGEIENFCPEVGLHGPKFVTKLLRDVPLGDDSLAELRSFVKALH